MKTPSGKRKSNHNKKDNSSEVSEEELEDISVIGNSVAVSIKGVRELIRAVSEGTQEFQDVMKNECSLIYECKVCQSLFRSVANFIAHKRHYCKKKYHSVNYGFHNNEPETGNSVVDNTELANEDSNKNKRDNGKLSSGECLPYIELSSLEAEASCRLENNLPTSSVVFQALVQNEKPSSLRQELRELEQSSSPQATIMADGSAHVAGYNGSHRCTVCQSLFGTSRALERHTNVYHQVRMCYPCPVCKLFFVSPWCVYRHLNKVHHKKEDQIRRLRPAVLSKAARRELYQPPRVISETQTTTASNASKRAEDEKWIAQFETELQNCKICNKSFSRRAALNVHSVMCKSRVKSPKSAEKTQPSNHSDNLRCKKCKKQFNRRAVLSAHEVSCTKSAVKPLRLHICKFCGRSYPRRHTLNLHLPNCPRAPPRSPLKHLLTPPKLSAAPNKQLSSPVQMKCDYNKMPPLFPRNGIIAHQTITSKLEAVVQKLHDNPTKTNNLSVTSQDNHNSLASSSVFGLDSKLIIAPTPFKVIGDSNTSLPSNGNVFISVPSNGKVANILPFLSLMPNPKFNFFPAVSNLSPRKFNFSAISNPTNNFVSLDNKRFTPKLVNGTVIKKRIPNTNSTVTICTSDSGHNKLVTVANKIVSPRCQYNPSSKSSPTKCAADSSSEVGYTDSLYSTPNLSQDNHLPDSEGFNLMFKEIERSDDSLNINFADDSGLSDNDDEPLPEISKFSRFSPFRGFDPPTEQDLETVERLKSLVQRHDSQINLEPN